jgi:hypothetical protein
VIGAFFTARGNGLYALAPGRPGRTLTPKEMPSAPSKVTLLGNADELKWTRSGQDLVIELPDLAEGIKRQYAYAIKLAGAAGR